MKRKSSKKQDKYTPQGYDLCQSPPYAVYPLLNYLPKSWVVWEPACGEGQLVGALQKSGYEVVASDIQPQCYPAQAENFFSWEPERWDCIVTNPPFSIKYHWLRRCFELGKPWALLLPIETLGAVTALNMFGEWGMPQLILMNARVNFKMPKKGWGGKAQFPVAWFTWDIPLPSAMICDYLVRGYRALHELRLDKEEEV